MTLWVCIACTTRFSVGAPACPQCGSREHFEEGQEMPKITVHGGATNAADLPAVSVAVDGVDQGSGEVVEFAGDVAFEALPEAVEGDTDEHVSEPNYENWTVKQLRESLAGRTPPLSTAGLKDELIARLREAGAGVSDG